MNRSPNGNAIPEVEEGHGRDRGLYRGIVWVEDSWVVVLVLESVIYCVCGGRRSVSGNGSVNANVYANAIGEI